MSGGQRFSRLLVIVLCAVAAAYAVDWTVMRVRIAHGTAYGTVMVNELLATPLKGNKVEYDVVGSAPQTCSRSLFPQAGKSACWWLERHTTEWE